MTNFERHMLTLWELADSVGKLGETDFRYALVYKKISEALDEAELQGLITYEEEDYE